MPSPKKPVILLLIPHLGGGGAERIIETLARCLSLEKYEIHLALILRSQPSHWYLTSRATIHLLGTTRVRHSVFKLVRLIWRLQPVLILSGMAHLSLLVLALKPLLPRKTRIIVRQNGALSATLAPHSRHLSRRAFSFSYRRADRVICQTDAMADEIQHGLDLEPRKLLVLPNPTDISHIRSSTSGNPERIPSEHTIIAVGRLVPEKGFDLLLDAFANLPSAFSSAQLFVIGTGPEQSSLERQAQQLRIRHRVRFTGHVADPAMQLRQASLFVLSSRTEGLPNAMLEAAAAGLPIVATPASAGLVDMLRNREGVWLASEISVDALRLALQQALSANQPGRRYSHAWIEPYDLSRAISAYESAIDDVIAGCTR